MSDTTTWEETAAQFHRNAEYYRGLVDEVGRLLGREAYTCDDGSVSEDVLRAKVPELVARRLADRETTVVMFLGWLSADIPALHHEHPDQLLQSWYRFKERVHLKPEAVPRVYEVPAYRKVGDDVELKPPAPGVMSMHLDAWKIDKITSAVVFTLRDQQGRTIEAGEDDLV